MNSSHAPNNEVLRLENVTVEAEETYDSAIWDVSFSLREAELMLLRVERERAHLPLADAAVGLIKPREGRVKFRSEDWQEIAPRRADDLRGKIGRIFTGWGWVSHLSVDENILLATVHHTSKPRSRIEDESATLARAFGLPGLPRGLPGKMRRSDLARAACVRAFLNDPRLLILETPTDGPNSSLMSVLVNMTAAARRRGAAVLWTTAEARVWSDPALRPTARAIMSGSQMLVTAMETIHGYSV